MITIQRFGTLPNGEPVNAYRVRAESGLSATFLNYGATLQSLILPDGRDIVLGFDHLEDYLKPHAFFGAAIGRVANRIEKARFVIDGQNYKVSANEGVHALHGGPVGFDRVNWTASVEHQGVKFTHISPEGHQGYPGKLKASFRYSLDNEGLCIEMMAETSHPTPVNLSAHSYFNLGDVDINQHKLSFPADYFFETDKDGINHGEACRLDSHEFDFRASEPISERAFDHHFNIPGTGMRRMATLFSPDGLHRLIVLSDLPGMQVYSGQAIPPCIGKNGRSYGPFSGIAFEPQFPPNAVNLPGASDIILRPGQRWTQTILYKVASLKTV
jgi:aldose 1-epimerase